MSADIDFVLVFPILFACRTLFFKSLLACIFGPKNLPKTLPKRSPNPSKINAKNVLVFYIDFFASWPRFWSLLGLQLGAKLASGRSNSELEPPPLIDLNLDVLKNCVLEGSKLDFEGSGPRFWRVWGQFFRDFHMFLAMYADNLPRTCRELAEAHDACLDR